MGLRITLDRAPTVEVYKATRKSISNMVNDLHAHYGPEQHPSLHSNNLAKVSTTLKDKGLFGYDRRSGNYFITK